MPSSWKLIADNHVHRSWHIRACEYVPTPSSIARVVRALQIDTAHVQGGFPLLSELLQSAHAEQHVNR